MSEFHPGGYVEIPGFIREAFEGYVTCLLWTATWESDTGEAPEGYDNSDIELTEDVRAALLLDLVAFLDWKREDCEEFAVRYLPKSGAYSPWECVGHDFALTRNHHGAGFWDRGLGDLGERLTEAAQSYGSCDLIAYLDDDEITVEITS